jgi:hypothetical protein
MSRRAARTGTSKRKYDPFAIDDEIWIPVRQNVVQIKTYWDDDLVKNE